jgi:hypothetical protein
MEISWMEKACADPSSQCRRHCFCVGEERAVGGWNGWKTVSPRLVRSPAVAQSAQSFASPGM